MFSTLVEAVINSQTRNFLSENDLAEFLKKKQFPEEYTIQIFNFFTDVPVPAVCKFAMKHRINTEDVRDYYLTYVKNAYPNPELEEALL